MPWPEGVTWCVVWFRRSFIILYCWYVIMLKIRTKNLISILAFLFLTTSSITSLTPFVITSVNASNNSSMSLASSEESDFLQSESLVDPANIETKKVRAGDIEIGYKMFGKGDPILFIPGFSMTMDMWEPMLNKLPSNHTIILFDNRGIGQTTAGNNTAAAFTIEQFANDTAALIDALEVKQPIDVLGLSLGGFIAQELALLHPDKVNRLILVASSCGGNETVPPQVSPQDFKSMVSGNATKEVFQHTLFPRDWIQNNTEYIENEFIFPTGKISAESLQLYSAAAGMWKSCERLSNLSKSALVVTGTQDITSPPANSVMLAEKIPGAWLVQIEGGGHGVMFQYPQLFEKVLETFLHVT